MFRFHTGLISTPGDVSIAPYQVVGKAVSPFNESSGPLSGGGMSDGVTDRGCIHSEGGQMDNRFSGWNTGMTRRVRISGLPLARGPDRQRGGPHESGEETECGLPTEGPVPSAVTIIHNDANMSPADRLGEIQT